jgi:hypothetical protein
MAFLLARIGARALSERSLSWVGGADRPWTFVDPVDVDPAVAEDVFRMYAQVYGAIDRSLNIGGPDGLFEFDRWILVQNAHGALMGFVLLKSTPFGLKVGLTGSDGSVAGRKAIKAFHRRVYRERGVYAEVSDALEAIVKDHAPTVPVDLARLVLRPKEIHPQADGCHYSRIIARIGRRTKLMVGTPIMPSG